MKDLINQQSITDLKKSRTYIIWGITIVLLLASAISVPLFLFASRDNKILFNILLAVLWTVTTSIVLYFIVVSLVPINNLIKISNASLSGNKFSTKARVISINTKVTHYRGIAVSEMKVLDLEENNKEYIFYVEESSSSTFEVNKEYQFVTYQSVVVSYEDL